MAGRLVGQICLKHGEQPRGPAGGSSQTDKCTAQLLDDLGITQSLPVPTKPSTHTELSRGALYWGTALSEFCVKVWP